MHLFAFEMIEFISLLLPLKLDQKNLCMRAYALLKCVAIWNLVYDAAK